MTKCYIYIYTLRPWPSLDYAAWPRKARFALFCQCQLYPLKKEKTFKWNHYSFKFNHINTKYLNPMYNGNNSLFFFSAVILTIIRSYTRYSRICKSSGFQQAVGMPVLRTRLCRHQEVNDDEFKYTYESIYTCVLLGYYNAALHYKRYLRFFHKLKIEMLSPCNCQMQVVNRPPFAKLCFIPS